MAKQVRENMQGVQQLRRRLLMRQLMRQALLQRSIDARDTARREIQRMRERGFSHHVDPEQARIDYYRRVEMRRRRRQSR